MVELYKPIPMAAGLSSQMAVRAFDLSLLNAAGSPLASPIPTHRLTSSMHSPSRSLHPTMESMQIPATSMHSPTMSMHSPVRAMSSPARSPRRSISPGSSRSGDESPLNPGSPVLSPGNEQFSGCSGEDCRVPSLHSSPESPPDLRTSPHDAHHRRQASSDYERSPHHLPDSPQYGHRPHSPPHSPQFEDRPRSPSHSRNSPPAIQQPQPLRVTNFFIDDILRPDFGQKLSHESHSVFPPYHPAGLNLSLNLNPLNLPGQLHRRHSDSSDIKDHYGSSQRSPGAYSLPSPGKSEERRSVKPEPGSQPPGEGDKNLWPAWVYCTRYSDRPSSGPRSRKSSKKEKKVEDKRPRTAFTNEQLARLKREFDENRYLTEQRRQDLARELKLNESQIKIWFQNKRAKMKKNTGPRNGLALQLMAQGLYNHATVEHIDVESLN